MRARLLVVMVAVVAASVGAGCGSSESTVSTSAGIVYHTFVGTSHAGVAFISWTRTGSQVGGDATEVAWSCGKNVVNANSPDYSLSGTIIGTVIRLRTNEDNVWHGTLSGSGFNLTYRDANDHVVTSAFRPGNWHDFVRAEDEVSQGICPSPPLLALIFGQSDSHGCPASQASNPPWLLRMSEPAAVRQLRRAGYNVTISSNPRTKLGVIGVQLPAKNTPVCPGASATIQVFFDPDQKR